MKKIILSGSVALAAVALASFAQAADVAVAPAYDWSGFYLGASAGVAWNNSSLDNDVFVDGTRYKELENRIEGDQVAFTAGGLLGYNYQIDQIVLGAEADFNYLGFSDSHSRNYSDTSVLAPGDSLDVNAKSSLDVDWFGTIRGRLGYAIDNVLIYGTGGLAYGHVNGDAKVSAEYTGPQSAPPVGQAPSPVSISDSWNGSHDSTNWGWTVGGGMEYGINNWSLGVEYLYVNLGDGNWSDNHDPAPIRSDIFDTNLKGSADFAFSVVRATAKVRF